MNRVEIIGNLTADPEIQTVQTVNGPQSVCNFTIAVNRRRGNEADYFRCTAWGKTGEIIKQYAGKGKKLYVSGEVSARAYKAANGEARASLEISVKDFEFLSPKEQDSAGATAGVPKSFVPVEDEDLPWGDGK